jgi:hypothetical protein
MPKWMPSSGRAGLSRYCVRRSASDLFRAAAGCLGTSTFERAAAGYSRLAGSAGNALRSISGICEGRIHGGGAGAGGKRLRVRRSGRAEARLCPRSLLPGVQNEAGGRVASGGAIRRWPLRPTRRLRADGW